MKRVLIIEDDDNNAVLISDLLRHAGYTPLNAETGEDGVRMALAARPDFILLDIQLPDIDGYQVVARLHQTPLAGQIPVIAITSYAMSGDRERLLAAGCSGYIEKPIDPGAVIETIRDIVGDAA